MKIKLFTYYLLVILYLEIVFKIAMFEKIFSMSLLNIFIFSLPIVLFLTIISKLIGPKINKLFTFIFTIIMIIYFETQLIFHRVYDTFLSFYSLNMTDQAFDFVDIIIDTIFKNILVFILLLLPLLILIILNKKIKFDKYKIKKLFVMMIIFLLFVGINFGYTLIGKNKMYSVYQLGHEINDNNLNVESMGLLTAGRLDLQRLLFGFNEKIISHSNDGNSKPSEPENIIEYNKIDTDYETLISNTTNKSLITALNYISSKTPTKKNDYTGIYKGKNLIFILAEGFNSIAVDQNITPTLYKLVNESFVFENFYSPVFLSTTGGEFQATTGLVPTQKILSDWKAKGNTFSFALGNAFKNINYLTSAYHDWTYTYYKRNKTMATLGFNNFIGCGNGLETKMNCKMWPTSDIAMVEATYPDYINQDKPFVTYYVSVSGHAEYNFMGNNMAVKNKDAVKDLPYGEHIKAYYATQIEFDKALELLIQKLTEAGKLDDTVIAIVGDHYPYTLTLDEINSVSSFKRDSIVGVNKSNFILWNSTTPKTIINKTGSQIDVLPTLLNLFGVDYDSRTIMGNDILSDTEGLAIFSNRSWVTDKGTYFTNSKKFVPVNENEIIEDDYISRIQSEVSNRFTISQYIVEYGIYELLYEGEK